MAVRKLPKDVQTLVIASITINSFKTAVEELVYNALDADSTSIAVRVNITENTIQVIDNGCGIPQANFTLLGQRYATSKCVDLATLKSKPNKYGYKGQFLSSLVQVSRSLKVTSRIQDTDETWCKCFEGGRDTDLYETANRPSKGTTVEVKDFLYNLNIRKNSINTLQELRDIKTFLEQLSLVHSNVSISLRDDSNNEIVFQLHKNRDIYQTLSTLFDVEKPDLQELIVEKNQYKAVAYVGKIDKVLCSKHWIYINGKLTRNGNLHKTINVLFVKMLHLKFQTKRKVKTNATLKEEENIPSNTKIPFYVILITCPYYDYDMSYTPKHSMLEFKNWECVSNLLEKLVKFYTGDMKLKEVKDSNVNKDKQKPKARETRDQVRKIVQKMLGSTRRKPGVSQMQNGIKGKPIKRKNKKAKSAIDLDAMSKIIPPRKTKSDQSVLQKNPVADVCIGSNSIFTFPSLAGTEKSNTKKTKKPNKREKLVIKTVTPSINAVNNSINIANNTSANNNEANLKERPKIRKQTNATVRTAKKYKPSKLKIAINNKNVSDKLPTIKKKESKISKTIPETAEPTVIHDPLLKKFENQTTSVKRKCEILANNVDDLLNCRKKSKREVFVNEMVHYSNITQDNKTVSVRQKIKEIVVHDFIPYSQNQPNPCTFDNRNWKALQNNVHLSTYDLLVPILTTQTREHDEPSQLENIQPSKSNRNELNYSKYFECPDNYKNTYEEFEEVTSHQQLGTKLTYESHHYGKYVTNDQCSHTNVHVGDIRKTPREFITTHSKDNFEEELNLRRDYQIGFKSHFQQKLFPKRRTLFDCLNHNKIRKYNLEESEYTIEFSKSKENNYLEDIYNADVVNNEPRWDPDDLIGCEKLATYTIIEQSSTNDKNMKSVEIGETHRIPKTSLQIEVCYESQESIIQDNADFLRAQGHTIPDCVIRKPANVYESRTEDANENHKTVLNNCTNKNKRNDREANETSENTKQIKFIFISETKEKDNTSNHIQHSLDAHSKKSFVENPAIVGRRLNDSLFADYIDLDSNKNTNEQQRNDTEAKNKSKDEKQVRIIFVSKTQEEDNASNKIQHPLDTHNQNNFNEKPEVVGQKLDGSLFNGIIDLDSDKNTVEQQRNDTKAKETSGNGKQDRVVFVSKTQKEENAPFQIQDPLDEHIQNDFDEDLSALARRLNDSLFNGDIDLDSVLFDRNIYLLTLSSDSNKAIDTNNHETNQNMVKAVTTKDHNRKAENYQETTTANIGHEAPEVTIVGKVTETANFDIKNRHRFIPKGLSPIFENCQTKTISNYEFDKEYYEDNIYNNFANDVHVNTEIFEPRVQNVKELVTKDIEKVNSRIIKDNASLVFDTVSLKNILVLGQLDDKFIAAKITGKSHQDPQNATKSLVLFDQHAVHERIRLEKNLSEYFNGKQWKSIALDEITVKLSKEEILYLHNYREKFMQFGLQWSISHHCEVAITAIPEAVLGKNPRQVEVIVTAVKNLILEEISAIKNQKGCVIMYPKSIMELVFSEACRYAIKFGDRLSKAQCQELLRALSECNTPFQCAHGRPVMAVLIDIHEEVREYKANPNKLLQFSRKTKKITLKKKTTASRAESKGDI